MKKSLSGTFIPDEVSSVVGRFILRFGYCEFLLLIYYNEIHDDAGKAIQFLKATLKRRVGLLKGEIGKLTMKKDDRKALLELLSRFEQLAHKRNLVCHNPYMTIPLGHGKHHGGAIFGARAAVKGSGDQGAVANVSDLTMFDESAARLQADLHKLFPVFQSALPPKH